MNDVPLQSNPARGARLRIGDLLIQAGLLSPEGLERALDTQRRSGKKLGRVLTDLDLVSEDQISRTVAAQLKLDFVDLSRLTLDPAAVQLLSELQARRFRSIVLAEQGSVVRIGMADPTDFTSFDEITRILRKNVEVAVVSESQLFAAIDRSYRRTHEIADLAQELTSEVSQSIQPEVGEILGLSDATAEDAPVVRLLATVFDEALRMRASDVHIEPLEQSLRIRFRIDGVLYVQTEADLKIAPAVALRLKLAARLDISERRLPQDGRFHLKLRNGGVDVRISTLPTQYGESVVMRLLNQANGALSLDRLGLPVAVHEALLRAMRRPSGMVLVTGPTGSGKTTTLYAALGVVNTDEHKVITVEDPVEYRLPGLNQVQVNEKIDLGFDRVLRSALRQDPDVVLVGEMRDNITAEIGMRAAMTGHLVLSTLHTNDAISTPIRLLDMGVPRYLVALSIQLVIAQRLVRAICEHCAQPHEPTPQEAAWLHDVLDKDRPALAGAPLQRAFRRGRGCPSCHNTGYSGRIAVFEFLEMSSDLADALNHEDPRTFAQLARQQMAGRTFGRDALRHALAGRTTLAEALRVVNELAF